MKLYLHILLKVQLLFMLLIFGHEATAGNTYYFSNIGLKDKLSQLSVLQIHEDYKGYMWFGTRNGLNRFDGNEMKVYKHQNMNENGSLADNHITAITESKDHLLWVGSMQGLTSIDLTNNKTTPFHSYKYSLLNGGTRALLSDSGGRLWIGTPNGLCTFNEKDRSFHPINLKGHLENRSISSLMETTSRHIWIGTEKNGVYRYQPKTQEITHYSTDNPLHRLSDNSIAYIYEDTHKSVWIATKNGGLCKYNPDTGNMQYFNTGNSSLTTNNIRTIVQVDQNLFIGTFDGLFVMDINSEKISIVSHEGKGKGQLSHFSIYSLCTDRSKGLWVGTYSGGVNYYSMYNNRFTLHEPTNYIRADLGIYGQMTSYAGDKLYISTEGSGLLEYDVRKKTYQCYRYHNRSQIKGHNIIKSIVADHSNKLLCGTAEGEVFIFDPSTKQFKEYFSLHQNISVYAIHHDRDGGLWLGTSKGNIGLLYLDKDKKLTTQFRIKGQQQPYTFPSMRCMLALGDDIFLLGTRNNGLIRFDAKKNEMLAFTKEGSGRMHLPCNYVASIVKDARGNIWIGTFGGGLCQYNDKVGIVKTVNQEDGLKSDEIYMIVPDAKNRLWLSNGNCITSYQPSTGNIHNYQVDIVGVQEFSPNSGIRMPNGDICFSASNGFISFNPDHLRLNTYCPPIVLNNLSINNKWITPDDNNVIDKSLDDVETLRLAHNQNNITISYCALNYSYPQQNQYAYRLVGHDKEWNYVGNRHEAYYTNLSPGEYVFELKAANNDGIWNKNVKKLSIVVTPPIWATWYAYLFYICAIAGILFLILYYINKKRALEQALFYEQKEQKQQNEFHQAKMNMYTSFSHELRTPLQLIISPLESLINDHAFNLETKNKLELIYNNSQRLLLLVNQLMDLRKSSSGKMQIKVGQYDLYAFINEIYRAFKNIANDKGIELTYNQENNHLTAWFDKSLFEKILFNLLSNALKNTPLQGKITISIDPIDLLKSDDIPQEMISRLSYTTNLYRLRISDNGQGIPEEEIYKIFEPFYQSSTTLPTGIGSGIGLSLTKSIVQLHHGVVWARNNIDGGATFNIIFPIDKECYTAEDIIEKTSNNLVQDVIPPTHRLKIDIDQEYKVLLVEDNHDVRTYIRDCLKPYFTVLEAENGKVGLEIAVNELPDIIISDIMMPEIDGIELCRQIKEDMQTGHIPVVLMTAKAMVEHIIEGYDIGADDYIVKPFSIDVLIHRIKNILETRKKLKNAYGKRFSPEVLGGDLSSSQDQFMQKLFETIEKNLSNPELNIDFICKEIGVSRSNLYKKLRTVTQLSPIEIIRDKRLEVATKLLLKTDYSILDIAVQTGFSSQAYFSKCFKMVYNCSPTEYIEKYRHQ
jgi:signal transduction histidine kinase/ligand-binding sensor domain-containing protein/DNA-binding response OmpR family regulator